MRKRVFDILKEPNQFIQEGETLILIRGKQATVLYNDGQSLCEIAIEADSKLQDWLERIKN